MNNLQQNDLDMKLILDNIKQGDKQSYSVVIHRFQRKIYLYCYYLLKNQEEAEDATQDIFIKALDHINSFTYTNSLSSWLYKIAKNHCTDLIKKRNKEYESLKKYQVNKQQEQEHTYSEFIDECLDKLNLEERQILLLRSLEEYSYDEMAFIMGLKPATLRKKYERIHKKLIHEKKLGGKKHEESYRFGS
ncbi:RNA polymerase sigma factor [Paenibacillus crassostreae]|uniref:RNA polymerase subunit sigma n=1 Tax=Paenibacillus crassostreae TaxID=1763538 RepID=A0A167FXB3_9BACL|nr:RNA polymerase sigma factor [Paenibacillus crassostreae]AOZ93972.1 RNA polymerase subunit sigma [Paenibacillus crassostreae]OAB76993.1 RNA polymerase subunit sigma [Paenibacillus crassostreae]